jgi:CBS-domain-containing membrane protein
MARFERAFDRRFAPYWISYIAQSVMAAGAVLLALVALRERNLVVAASLAATAFTVFTMPSSVTASSRNVIGGHVIGLAFGSLFALLPVESGLAQDVVYALAVGASMLAMAVTNTEHPPAAGTALGVVTAGFSLTVVMGVIVGVGILAAVHRVLRPALLDLIAAPEKQVEEIEQTEQRGPVPK